MQQLTQRFVAMVSIIISGVIIVVPAVVAWLTRSRFPEQVAIHWGLDGQADGWQAVTGAIGFPVVFGLGMAAVLVGIGVAMKSMAFMGPVAVGLASFLSLLMFGGLFMQMDGGAAVPIGPLMFVSVLLLLLVSSLGVWLLKGRIRLPGGEGGTFTPSTPGVPTERTWEGRTRSGAGVWILFGILAVLLAVPMVLLWGTEPWLGASFLLLALPILPLTLVASKQRIVIDERGLTTTFAGISLYKFPLDQLVSAGVVDVDPLGEYGGIGLRSSLDGKRDGVVTGAGEALILQRTDAKDFVITTDGARQGARVLAMLIAERNSDEVEQPG